MNKILLISIIFSSVIAIVSITSLYEVQISPRTVQAFPFVALPPTDFGGYSYQVLNSSDLCSPEGSKNVYIGGYGSKSTMPCLEQINLKLDKLISLEEQENKP